MTVDDLDYVVDEHRRSLPAGVYAQLGPRFLRVYHATNITSSGAVAFIGGIDGCPFGFLTGVVGPAEHRLAMRAALPHLTLSAAIGLAHQPKLGRSMVSKRSLQRLGSLVGRSRSRPSVSSGTSVPAGGVLTYLAVNPSARGLGVGAALMQSFLEVACARGCDYVTLTTKPGTSGAEAFYLRHGWSTTAQHHTPVGQPLSIMRRSPCI